MRRANISELPLIRDLDPKLNLARRIDCAYRLSSGCQRRASFGAGYYGRRAYGVASTSITKRYRTGKPFRCAGTNWNVFARLSSMASSQFRDGEKIFARSTAPLLEMSSSSVLVRVSNPPTRGWTKPRDTSRGATTPAPSFEYT